MFTAKTMLSICQDLVAIKVVHDVSEYYMLEDFATYTVDVKDMGR